MSVVIFSSEVLTGEDGFPEPSDGWKNSVPCSCRTESFRLGWVLAGAHPQCLETPAASYIVLSPRGSLLCGCLLLQGQQGSEDKRTWCNHRRSLHLWLEASPSSHAHSRGGDFTQHERDMGLMGAALESAHHCMCSVKGSRGCSYLYCNVKCLS